MSDSKSDSGPKRPALTVIEGSADLIEQGGTGKLTDPQGNPVEVPWQNFLLKSSGKKGPAKKVFANALVPLRRSQEWEGVLRYDASALTVILAKAPPWHNSKGKEWKSRPWTDQDDRLWTEWLQKRGIDVGIAIAAEAIQANAREHSFHPIRDYLNSLKWDGVKRLDTWLCVYCGAEDTAYHRMVSWKWPMSGVARIMTPGVSADYVLLLEGSQGLGKTRLLRAFAVRSEWFSDEIRDLGGREAAMGLAGRWIIEFPETVGLQGKTDEARKAFLSRTVDRYRPPWGRGVGDFPRQCIFASTTNELETLSDASGNRRYWPVKCTQIDVDAMERDAEQIWAEAVVRWRNREETGERWWPVNAEEVAMATGAQEDRFELDPLEEDIKVYLAKRSETSVTDLIEEFLEVTVAKASRRDRMRLAKILQHLGWEPTRASPDAGGERKRVYIRNTKSCV